jgi:hypothetical protein
MPILNGSVSKNRTLVVLENVCTEDMSLLAFLSGCVIAHSFSQKLCWLLTVGA